MVVSALLMACNSSAEEADNHTTAPEEQEHHDAGVEGLMLNHGARWVANPETTAGISSMQQAIQDSTQAESPAGCAQLAARLTASFDGIIRQCTMTGEAHEQLHHYILPLKRDIATLSTAEGTDCAEQVVKMATYLSTYADYFE